MSNDVTAVLASLRYAKGSVILYELGKLDGSEIRAVYLLVVKRTPPSKFSRGALIQDIVNALPQFAKEAQAAASGCDAPGEGTQTDMFNVPLGARELQGW